MLGKKNKCPSYINPNVLLTFEVGFEEAMLINRIITLLKNIAHLKYIS